MKKSMGIVLGLIFLAVGCTKYYTETCLYRYDGSLKPRVALLPVIDHSQTHCAWDLAKEFSEEIHRRILFSTKVYPVTPTCDVTRVRDLAAVLPSMIPSYVNQTNFNADYLVSAEILKHTFHKNEASLVTVVRVKMIDLHASPQVVLQEIITSDYPLTQESFGYDVPRWGSKNFDKTSVSLAHRKVFREVVNRIEEYARIR